MYRNPLVGLLFSFVLSLVIVSCGTGKQGDEIALYVAPDGHDSWQGTSLTKPFATIARARDAVREMKKTGTLTKPVNVYLRGGMYQLSEPVVFTPEDSGTSEYPVTYRAYNQEKPVISGGRKITGWAQSKEGVWQTSIPGANNGGWKFRQLFINGERKRRARIPNDGFFTVRGMATKDTPARLPFNDGDIKKEWANRGDVEVIALNKWTEYRLFIRSVDPKANMATLSQRLYPWIIENNARYWIENVPEALDAPGEWYLEDYSGVVSYIPEPGEDMASAEVIAPVLTELVRFNGEPEAEPYVSNLVLDGITFSYTAWTLGTNGYIDSQAANNIPGVIRGDFMDAVAIENCVIEHIGTYAIDFARGCRNIRIVGNELSDIGAGGVRIGETSARENVAEQTFGNLITDNHIHHIGEVYPEACGVIIFFSGKNTIAHNHIHDTYYTGISNGWSWGYAETLVRENIIEYNHVHDIGRGMLSDMGGNYNLGLQPGTVIRNNLFHDITSSGYGGWGIYTDEGSTGILIENNIVYRTKTGGFHQHYGRENTVRNNIFAFAKLGQIIRSRAEEHLSFTFERNIVIWDEGPLLGNNWGTTPSTYEDDGSLRKATSTTDFYRLDNNLYFQTTGEPFTFGGLSLEEWRARGQDVHSLIADPLFVDAQNGDFTLREGSPAFTLGFKEIDLSGVGPRQKR